jgi:hypothetical protein
MTGTESLCNVRLAAQWVRRVGRLCLVMRTYHAQNSPRRQCGSPSFRVRCQLRHELRARNSPAVKAGNHPEQFSTRSCRCDTLSRSVSRRHERQVSTVAGRRSRSNPLTEPMAQRFGDTGHLTRWSSPAIERPHGVAADLDAVPPITDGGLVAGQAAHSATPAPKRRRAGFPSSDTE